MATAEDVKTFDGRRIDKLDRERLAGGYYVIAAYEDDGKECLVDVGWLRATEGWKEINDARLALPGCPKEDA